LAPALSSRLVEATSPFLAAKNKGDQPVYCRKREGDQSFNCYVEKTTS